MDDLPDPGRRRLLTRLVRPEAEPPSEASRVVAAIGGGCLPHAGIDCQICRDACPQAAIRFLPRRGGPFIPDLRTAACTGCGECLPPCPAGAIRLEPVAEQADA